MNPLLCEHRNPDAPCMCGGAEGYRGSADCCCDDCEAMGCPAFEDEDEARECAGDLEELLDYALKEST